jgi:hypothetical protein
MNLTDKLESAEHRFKQILEEFFITLYDERFQTSHGIDHHRRVWNYAKKLLVLLDADNLISHNFSPSGLIIACYLHDIGMSIDPGISHGRHSREICSRFLKENKLNESDYLEVLEAIENHDDKEYRSTAGNYNLLTILSVADDLDAFGFTGIYRYSEIYLARGIDPEIIGTLVVNNASKRFDNFTSSFGFSEKLILSHRIRFDIIENFFTEYNKQVTAYQFGVHVPYGYCGVIDIIQSLIKNKNNLKDICLAEQYSHDPVIKWFFQNLINDRVI